MAPAIESDLDVVRGALDRRLERAVFSSSDRQHLAGDARSSTVRPNRTHRQVVDWQLKGGRFRVERRQFLEVSRPINYFLRLNIEAENYGGK